MLLLKVCLDDNQHVQRNFVHLKRPSGREEILENFHTCMLSRFWTAVHQAPLSTRFSQQEYWSGLLCPPPGHLLDPGIKPISLVFPALAGGFFATSHQSVKPLGNFMKF